MAAGVQWSTCEAEAIKREIGRFLKERLNLDLSAPKPLITHARTGKARFLGYGLTVQHDDRKLDRRGRRCLNGNLTLQVPTAVILAKSRPFRRRGKPAFRYELSRDLVFSIVARYQQEFRSIVEYYRLALNLYRLNRLK